MNECLNCRDDCEDDYCLECLDAIREAGWPSAEAFNAAQDAESFGQWCEPEEWDVIGGL